MVRCNVESSPDRHNLLIHLQYVMFIVILSTVLPTAISFAQPAQKVNKFLGNITTRGQILTDFTDYWNHLTGENECKWTSIESSRNVMNWKGADLIAKFAREKKLPWRFHSLLTSGSCPSWVSNIPDTTLLREIGEWMDLAAQRYPDATMIDVVNEGYAGHTFPGVLRTALGGNGATGFDWIIKAFRMARERWPKAILIYNDYNNIEWENEISWTIDLINALKKAGAPIDAIGCEASEAWKFPTSTIKRNIDRIAAAGLPVYISAYEIPQYNDTIQDSIMREQFTMMWNHPKIFGISLWGYVVGSTWRNGTGLVTTDGVERPALSWLKNYVSANPNPLNDFPDLLKGENKVKTTRMPMPVTSDTRQVIKNYYTIFNLQGQSAGIYNIIPSGRIIVSPGWYVSDQGKNSVNINGNIELKRSINILR